ncbi:MAG TPA: hypothetical protein VIM98_08615 [Dyella sp.]|uniref:hypothetical protein n=1 Tax=Dyella sp. TaxID=1869338 RepID=UPI002F92952F
MHFGFKKSVAALSLATTLMLGGCVPQATMTCTVTVSTQPVKQTGPKPQVIGAQDLQLETDVSVSGEMVPSSTQQAMAHLMTVAMPDAGSFSLDTSGSTVTWPATGTVTLTVSQLSSGAVIATSNFAYVKSGSVLVFADPTSVNNWLAATGADPASSKLAYTVAGFPVTPQSGTNVAAAAARADSTVMAQSAATFEGSSCPPGPHPIKCIPN